MKKSKILNHQRFSVDAISQELSRSVVINSAPNFREDYKNAMK